MQSNPSISHLDVAFELQRITELEQQLNDEEKELRKAIEGLEFLLTAP